MTGQPALLLMRPRQVWTAIALLVLLAGCVEPSPAITPTPVATAPDGTIEPVSGISRDALVGIMGIPDGGNELLFGVFYQMARIDRAQLAAAPARICKSRGRSLISAEDMPLAHPSELPGTRKMIVRCR